MAFFAVLVLAIPARAPQAQPYSDHMGAAMMGGRGMGPGMMGRGGMGEGYRKEEPSSPATKDHPAGARIFAAQCAVCHTLRAGAANAVGPNLHGLFGRKAASVRGFTYSRALRHSGIVWDSKTLGQFLANPAGFVPGTAMAFAGLRDPRQRRAVIAYLKEAAGN